METEKTTPTLGVPPWRLKWYGACWYGRCLCSTDCRTQKIGLTLDGIIREIRDDCERRMSIAIGYRPGLTVVPCHHDEETQETTLAIPIPVLPRILPLNALAVLCIEIRATPFSVARAFVSAMLRRLAEWVRN